MVMEVSKVPEVNDTKIQKAMFPITSDHKGEFSLLIDKFPDMIKHKATISKVT